MNNANSGIEPAPAKIAYKTHEGTEQGLHTLLYIGIIVSLICVFAADVMTPLGVAVWVIYIVPLTLSLWLPRPAVPLYIATAVTVLIVANFFADTPGLDPTVAQINRAMGAFTIWVLALVGHFFIRNRNAVRREEWLQTGQRRLNEMMLGEQQLEELGGNILGFLTDYLGALAGAFFVREGLGYERIATHGVATNGVPARFTPGDGLLGQVAKDRKAVLMHDVPEQYLSPGCAFGSGKPRHLAIFATAADHTTNGVIELGFVKDLDAAALDLLNRIAESIGIAIRSAHYRTHLQNLLEESQRQAEELQVQGEELKVSNEELEEQSRALQESQTRLEQQQAELEQTNAQLEEQTQLLEVQRDDLHRAQSSLETRSRELERASQYKSDFLANMSHELRTPLNSSLILAKLLADNPEGNLRAEQVMHAQTIQSAGNDLLNLINDILDLSKIEAGHMEIISEPVRLSALVGDLERTFQPMAQKKNLQLVCEIQPATPAAIESDGKRLAQILKNLLSNALKFTERGEVKLTISRATDGRIAFAVSDTGIGIAAENHEMVFDAFRQADGTTNRKFGGTGLGLSISRELAKILGGEIHLASEEGKGSVFTVTVSEKLDPGSVKFNAPAEFSVAPPRAIQRASAPTKAPEPSYSRTSSIDDDRERLSSSQQLVLVVEDDERFARILYDMAHQQKFQCIVSASADEASQLAERFVPSAVILDVGLPDHSGLSVLDRLKHNPRTRHIPVHVISAEDYAETAYSLGAISYMLKPVKREELLETFKQLEERVTPHMRRVLVVEDDPVQRDSIQKLLGAPGVTIVGAGTAAECLERLKEGTFDCMVLDISLPDESGYSLLETLSKEEVYSFPPVIVYTGRDLSSAQEQQLRRYSKSIIIKGAKSPERLLDEVTLFLHQVVNEMPPEHQNMLKKARNRDAVLEGRRILVVEDDIRNIYSISNILEPRGATVQIARNGREALEALEKSKEGPGKTIDLVLMDVMMPEMDGITATRTLRTLPEWKKLPVIMLTAKAMRNDQEQCLAAGANDYMAKPIDVDKLLSLVRVWMPR
jgi:CheY-like chemotaxis protein/signal transduction histidine kinase